MAWQRGPLPPDTFGYGGVVPIGQKGHGFSFAEFAGDHVNLAGACGVPEVATVLEPEAVAWWNNCLKMPPPPEPGAGGVYDS